MKPGINRSNKRNRSSRWMVVVLILALMAVGMCLGNYLSYARGFRHGRAVANAWWIDKQSRYYDSNEVEKKRTSNGLDWF